MALRLAATPGLRSTARLLIRQQPMGLVKIHSCKLTCLHFTRLLLISNTIAVAQSNAVAAHKPDRLHGSYHWDLERAASVALVPLIASQLAYGASPITDTLLGVVLPLHLHIGKKDNKN